MAIEAVIAQVQRALLNTQDVLAARKFPPLKEVRLTLQTVATRQAGGSVKLWVLAAGASVEQTATQQIVLALVPPKAREVEGVAPSLPTELEHAIRSAIEGVEKAREGPVPLVTNSLDVEINFVVKRSADGGLNLAVAPLLAGLSGGVASSMTQSVKVSFAGR